MNFYFTDESRDILKSFSFLITFKAIAKTKSGTQRSLQLEKKFQKLTVLVHVLQTRQNSVVSRCCFVENEEKCTKNYNAREQSAIVLLIHSFFSVTLLLLRSLCRHRLCVVNCLLAACSIAAHTSSSQSRSHVVGFLFIA